MWFCEHPYLPPESDRHQRHHPLRWVFFSVGSWTMISWLKLSPWGDSEPLSAPSLTPFSSSLPFSPPLLLQHFQVVWGPHGRGSVPECLSPQLQPLGPQPPAETTTGFQGTPKKNHFGKHKTSPHSALQWQWHFGETQWILLQNRCITCWDLLLPTHCILSVFFFFLSLIFLFK